MPSIQPTTKSKKPKKLVSLPGEYMTRVVIPTKLVNAEYTYTLIQERIFNYVLHYLQYYIKQVTDGKSIMQLELFKTEGENINISIPLMTIAKPAYYDRARDAAKQLAGILVSIPMKGSNGASWERVRGLFQWVDIPDQERRERSGLLVISMSKQVGQMLVDIEVKQGIPRDYTSFLFEVCMVAKNKYTPRFYKQLCSWKKKGRCYISLEELKTWLQLGSKYKTYNQIKQRILKPVSDELRKFADCWFDITKADFEHKEGTKVVGLWFNIDTPERKDHYVKLRESVINVLKQHFRLQASHLLQLDPILTESSDFAALQYKILDLAERVRSDKSIKNIQAYVVRSLLNYHKPRP